MIGPPMVLSLLPAPRRAVLSLYCSLKVPEAKLGWPSHIPFCYQIQIQIYIQIQTQIQTQIKIQMGSSRIRVKIGEYFTEGFETFFKSNCYDNTIVVNIPILK